jgi:hypothetical protein
MKVLNEIVRPEAMPADLVKIDVGTWIRWFRGASDLFGCTDFPVNAARRDTSFSSCLAHFSTDY